MARASRLVLALALFLLPSLSTAQVDRHGAPPVDPAVQEYWKTFQEGFAHHQAGRYPEGIAAFQRCLELRPSDEVSAYNIACAHSLTGATDLAFEWLSRALDIGFGYDEAHVPLLATDDPDLASLRTDPRFAVLVARMQSQVSAADEYARAPAVYVPESARERATIPLLVVLHDDGSTKDQVVTGPWRRVADELGFALLAPSGRFPSDIDPAAGMDWAPSAEHFLGDPTPYEQTVHDAVRAFREEHELDRDRVIVVGEGSSTWVAFHLATTTPGLYRGCVLRDGWWREELELKAAGAASRGLRVRVLFDASRRPREFQTAGPELARNTVTARLKVLGFPDPARLYRLDPNEPGDLLPELVGEVRALDEGL